MATKKLILLFLNNLSRSKRVLIRELIQPNKAIDCIKNIGELLTFPQPMLSKHYVSNGNKISEATFHHIQKRLSITSIATLASQYQALTK